ncbi:MAG: NADH-quinone oxidoreductase subunit J [Planctomycetes bacterium]|nr:NADH-quinone oxidoreductase subunit J [Planctomycetota bacterium]
MIAISLAQHAAELGLPVIIGLPILLGVVGYLFAVVSPFRRRSAPASICLLAAAICAWWFWWRPGQPPVESVLFTIFAAMMLAGGCGMQVEANPVYAALWFALVILSTCGLFLMQGAAFVSAATLIVYAGAIIVTFLFVIMLASQSGSSVYDRRFRNPFLSITMGGLLLAVLIALFKQPMPPISREQAAFTLSAPQARDMDTLAALGRSLFADHLWSVELAGVLLVIATFGSILIARQSREERG